MTANYNEDGHNRSRPKVRGSLTQLGPRYAIMRYDKISSNFEDKTMEIEEIQETMDSRG